MITDINSEDRLVHETFAKHLHEKLGWDGVYAWNNHPCCILVFISSIFFRMAASSS
jgi:hypothetical protein